MGVGVCGTYCVLKSEYLNDMKTIWGLVFWYKWQRGIFSTLCLLCVCSIGVGQGDSKGTLPSEGSVHFSSQLLNLEKELETFRDKIDEKESQIQILLKGYANELYMLRQQQRDSGALTEEEKEQLLQQIRELAERIRAKKLRMNDVMGAMERKRKDIFALKISINEWIAKVEATEISVIRRITRMKQEISELIRELDKEFHTNSLPVAEEE